MALAELQDAYLNSPWRAEPLYELAKWHDEQLKKCSANQACENKHHMGAFLNAKMVRPGGATKRNCPLHPALRVGFISILWG